MSSGSSLPPRASRQALSVLFSSTFAFTICFAVWTMFSVLGVPLKADLALSETQFGLLIATPVLTGSLIRVPLGMLTDRFGGRIVFFLVLLICVPPLYLMAYATTYAQFLMLALFVGLAGLAGGLGGFILPILFGVLLDATGVYSSAFMLLYGAVCVSLVFMHYSYRRAPRAGTELVEPEIG